MTIVPDTISGSIAGSAGILTAVVSVHLQNQSRRRYDHHMKHKENFEIIRKAIIETCTQVYPYIKLGRKEEPFITLPYEVNYKFWEYYSIFNYQNLVKENNEVYKIIKIDKLLYYDMKKHWPDFFKELNEWESKIKLLGKS